MRNFFKWSLFIISLLMFLVGYQLIGGFGAPRLGNAAPSGPQEETEKAQVPKAVFPETKYDFDSIIEGAEIKHDFVVENHGRAPLIIERVQPD